MLTEIESIVDEDLFHGRWRRQLDRKPRVIFLLRVAHVVENVVEAVCRDMSLVRATQGSAVDRQSEHVGQRWHWRRWWR